MGAIEKFVRNAAGRAIDKVQNIGDRFTSMINRVQGYVGTAFEVAKNGETFVGINYSEVPNIRAAISTYVSNVQTELGKLNTEASSSNAIKGEDVTNAVTAYVAAVDKVARAYVSSLLAYSDKMYEYANGGDGSKGMQQHQATLSENVSAEAKALTNDIEEYDPKY